MSIATSTIKCVLLVFNFFFALSSLGICFLGVIINSRASSIKEVMGGQISTLSGILILVGTLVFFVAFFGCCGVVRESHCMIVSYTVVLLTIFLTEACLGAIAFLNKNTLEEVSEGTLHKMLDDFYDNAEKRTFLDKVQSDLHCCGVKGPQDWKGQIPLSCCKLEDPKRTYCAQEDIFKIGCHGILVEQAKSLATHIGAIAIGVALLKIIGVIFSLCLANSIKNDVRRGYYVVQK